MTKLNNLLVALVAIAMSSQSAATAGRVGGEEKSGGSSGASGGELKIENQGVARAEVRPDPKKPEPTRPEPSRPAPSRPEPSRPAPSRPEPSRPAPSRPEPSRPAPGRPEPSRPAPGRPEPSRPAPGRPEPSRPAPNRPVPQRPGAEDRTRREVIDRRSHDVQQERNRRHDEIRRYQNVRFHFREDFRIRIHIDFHRDYDRLNWGNRWDDYYGTWYGIDLRPEPIRLHQPIVWYRMMPDVGSWSYTNLDAITDNLEYLSRSIYDKMARFSNNDEFSAQVLRSLYALSDAAQNYNDAVDKSYDWSASLYDLFQLNATLNEAETLLAGYPQAYRVDDEMRAMRYYVDELLWTYRAHY